MAAGAVVTCAQGLARPLRALQNTDLRFGILLVALLTMPIAAIVLVNATVIDGWRQLSFLYAPMCLLAVTGLHWIAHTHKLPGSWKAGGYFLAALGIVATAVQMVLIHPHQPSYFNILVDRQTPEHLRSQYEFDQRLYGCREGLTHLLQRYPNPLTIKVIGGYAIDLGLYTFPKDDRERIIQVKEDADFRILCGSMLREASANTQNEITVFTRKLYNNTLVEVKSSSCRSGEPILWTVPEGKSPWEVLAEAWEAE